jgi:hypothetical protein
VILPKEIGIYFPEFASYCGIPVLLGTGLYGHTLSPKWWNQAIADHLQSLGFHQSAIDRTYFVKYYPDGSYIRLMFHVDDMIYFGNHDEVEKEFEQTISKRFNVQFNGITHWFLQMRFHHHADGSITIDQHRFVLNLLKKFCDEKYPHLIPPERDTPGPPDYVFSISNRPTTEQEKNIIAEKYSHLDFCSCLCTILYLAYSTRPDILFMVCKLAKCCIATGHQGL